MKTSNLPFKYRFWLWTAVATVVLACLAQAQTLMPVTGLKGGTANRVLVDDGTRAQWATQIDPSAVPVLNASKITSGTLDSNRLENVVPSPGTVGDATHIPSITYDTKGRITNIATYTPTVTSVNGASYPTIAALGDLLYGSAANTVAKLSGNTSSTKNFLTQTGTGSASAAPAWGTIAAGDLPNHSTALLTSGQLALARGGTGSDLSATGGSGQVLKQTSAGGVVSVAALVSGDIPNLDGSKITTGSVATARLTPAGSDTQVQFNSSGSFGASSNLVWDNTNGLVKTGGITALNTSTNTFNKRIESRMPSGVGAVYCTTDTFATSGSSVSQYVCGTYSSGSLITQGLFAFLAAENNDATHIGTNLLVQLGIPGASTRKNVAQFYGNGSVALNATGSALSTSATDGFVYLGTCAGRPTGTPTSLTGAIPFVYDTTNDIFWAYNGSWKPIGQAGTTSTTAVNYTQPAYEATTIVTPSGASVTVTLPDPSTLPLGTVRRVVTTSGAGGWTTTVATAGAGASVVGTATSTGAVSTLTAINTTTTQWVCTKST